MEPSTANCPLTFKLTELPGFDDLSNIRSLFIEDLRATLFTLDIYCTYIHPHRFLTSCTFIHHNRLFHNSYFSPSDFITLFSLVFFGSGEILSKDSSLLSPTAVLGRYAPPANVYPQCRHFQILVPERLTAEYLHSGHTCFFFCLASRLPKRLRILTPYLGPSRPDVPTFFVRLVIKISQELGINNVFRSDT